MSAIRDEVLIVWPCCLCGSHVHHLHMDRAIGIRQDRACDYRTFARCLWRGSRRNSVVLFLRNLAVAVIAECLMFAHAIPSSCHECTSLLSADIRRTLASSSRYTCNSKSA